MPNPFNSYALGRVAPDEHRPATPGRYFDGFRDLLAAAPSGAAGHDALVSPDSWGALGSRGAGVSVLAAAAHVATIQSRLAGAPQAYTDVSVMSDYVALTGYGFTPESDTGLQTERVLERWRTEGLTDYRGEKQRIAGWFALHRRSPEELALAVDKFGAALLGVEATNRFLDALGRGNPVDVAKGARNRGGVSVAVVGRRESGNFVGVVWGTVFEFTTEYYLRNCDEVHAVVPLGALDGTRPVAGFRGKTLVRANAERDGADPGEAVAAWTASLAPAPAAQAESTAGVAAPAAEADAPGGQPSLFDSSMDGGASSSEPADLEAAALSL